MFDFQLLFSDGTKYTVKNVKKVIYSVRDLNKVVSGENILSERIPIADMSLYTDENCVSISGKDLLIIDISKHAD